MMTFEPGTDPREVLEAMSNQRKREIDEHYLHARWRLFWYFCLVLVIWAGVEWAISLLPIQPGASLVSVSDIEPAEAPALCPGDKLEFIYNIDSVADGVVDINLTLYRKTAPARTIIYSEPLTDIIIDPERQQIHAVWPIPHETIDPFSGEMIQLAPGEYQRRISISTTSRSTKPVTVLIDFSIKENCSS